MVKVLVVDAQCIVRMGMKQLCCDIGGFTVTGEAANGPRIRNARSSDGGADLIDAPSKGERAPFSKCKEINCFWSLKMNTKHHSPDPEVSDDEELEQQRDRTDDVAEETPDKAPELPSSLSFPNKFFQG
ncbi:MAG TPA: hypothetical protein VFF26_07075 [Gallionella sp.]|nr:hypothetical protein [Gallionella sp.]